MQSEVQIPIRLYRRVAKERLLVCFSRKIPVDPSSASLPMSSSDFIGYLVAWTARKVYPAS